MAEESIIDLLEFKVYVGESVSPAATAKRQDEYTSSDSEAEEITPRTTRRKRRTSVEVTTQDARRTGSICLLRMQSVIKTNG